MVREADTGKGAILPLFWVVSGGFSANLDSTDREYTRAELRRALERTGFEIQECRTGEEDLSSLLRFLRRRGGWKEALAQRRALLVRTLGNIWSPLRLPFGRLLWAAGRKPTRPNPVTNPSQNASQVL
jgi:hypothetical protein